MSSYSTLKITRSKAIEELVNEEMKTIKQRMIGLASGLTDRELEDKLDVLLVDRLYNVIVVSDDTFNNDNFVL